MDQYKLWVGNIQKGTPGHAVQQLFPESIGAHVFNRGSAGAAQDSSALVSFSTPEAAARGLEVAGACPVWSTKPLAVRHAAQSAVAAKSLSVASSKAGPTTAPAMLQHPRGPVSVPSEPVSVSSEPASVSSEPASVSSQSSSLTIAACLMKRKALVQERVELMAEADRVMDRIKKIRSEIEVVDVYLGLQPKE